MNAADFLISSQVVIKLEKLDENCMEIYTEVPQIIKQEPELSIKLEIHTESDSYKEDSQSTKEDSKIKSKKKKYVWIKTKMRCEICKVTLSSKQSLNYHNNAFHSNRPMKVFQCHLCTRSFPQHNFLKSHLRTHNEKNIFECDICGKNKLSRLRLQRHMAMHRTIMTYQCDLCPKAFKSKKYISRHVVTHVGELDNFCG